MALTTGNGGAAAGPELLAPAGNWECARAAVANGANAIFFGMPRFNARLRADNFTPEDLPALMRYLHEHNVRGYVTMNTLIFPRELPDAAEQLGVLEAAGVDAIIVQDLGLARLSRLAAPGLRLHASTQMTITSPEGLEFARELKLDRAVLARELSLRELERFRETVVPLEVFVHGALCVAYSGQCLTSESLGKRSANRGECAQACRMPYELVVDGETRDLGDRRYLLSPQDLAAVEEIPRLIELGVRSFKIEGRLKSPEYVAAVTRVYRQAIDRALAGQKKNLADKADRYALEMTFSRGLFTGWLHGVNHQRLVGARFGKKRGPFAGRVVRVGPDWVELDALGADLKPGDGVVFDTGGDTNAEQGGRVFEIRGNRLTFQRGKLDFRQVRPGDRVWKTSDPALERRLRATWKDQEKWTPRTPLRLTVEGAEGEFLTVAEERSGVVVRSAMPLAAAERRPLTEETLREQLGRLGGTGYELERLESRVRGAVMLPLSELNRLRRELVERLEERKPEDGWFFAESPVNGRGNAGRPSPAEALETLMEPVRRERERFVPAPEAELTALCRSREQIEACAEAGMRRVYVDFEDVRGYAAAVAWARAESELELFLATPRIQKPGEQGFFKLIERAAPHGVLVRNLGAIRYFRERDFRCVGDFSLNVANPLTAAFLRARGLERLTVSYDLNINQVLDLLADAPPDWFELTLHQHMPMFHMEHCVFAAFLSKGSSFLDCGRPCERHSVKLRDRVGMEHPLKADAGCRNTLFNSQAQTGARYYQQLHAAGLRRFRVDFLEEDAAAVRRTLGIYRELLSGRVNGSELWRDLRAQSKLGVTLGTLEESPARPAVSLR